MYQEEVGLWEKKLNKIYFLVFKFLVLFDLDIRMIILALCSEIILHIHGLLLPLKSEVLSEYNLVGNNRSLSSLKFVLECTPDFF